MPLYRCPCGCGEYIFLKETADVEELRCPYTSARIRPGPQHLFDLADWNRDADVVVLKRYVGEAVGPRKLRLFSAACTRRLTHLLDRRMQRFVHAFEDFATGRVAAGAWRAVQVRRLPLPGDPPGHNGRREDWAAWYVAQVLGALDPEIAFGLAVEAGREMADRVAPWARVEEVRSQCQIFREIVGNPFRPVALDPAWLSWNDGTVPRLARAIADARDFADLPVLGDALEEAGCADDAILDHCRAPGVVHVPGCWLLDRILERS
jgi:hypothetical protein